MQNARWLLLSALLVASCKEEPAIAGKFPGHVMVAYEPTAPGGMTASGETGADGVEVTPLEDSKYRVSFGACSATFKRPEKSSDNKGIWKLVAGGPCATKQGDATIMSGEVIDFGKGSFVVGLKGMTKDEKLSVAWSYVNGPQK